MEKIYRLQLNWKGFGWMDAGGPYSSREKAEKDLEIILKQNKGGNPDAQHRIVEEKVQ